MTGLERALGDAIADGRCTDHDADEVRRFADLLGKLGPVRHEDRDGKQVRVITRDEAAAIAEYYRDDDAELHAHYSRLAAGGAS